LIGLVLQMIEEPLERLLIMPKNPGFDCDLFSGKPEAGKGSRSLSLKRFLTDRFADIVQEFADNSLSQLTGQRAFTGFFQRPGQLLSFLFVSQLARTKNAPAARQGVSDVPVRTFTTGIFMNGSHQSHKSVITP
jgi:hypothetical protein